jgi:hypothetical protein
MRSFIPPGADTERRSLGEAAGSASPVRSRLIPGAIRCFIFQYPFCFLKF